MTFQPGTVNYTQGFGSAPENVEVPHLDNRPPTTADVNYPIGKSWIDSTGNAQYVLTSKSSFGGTVTANWQVTASGTGAVATINNLPPTAGNITIAGTANQIAIANAGSTVTLSVPATFIAPGSIAATTTVTGGTGVTATTGNVTATNGNLVLGSAGNKLVIHATTAASDSVGLGTLNGAGTVTISTTACTTSSKVFVSVVDPTNPGFLSVPSASILNGSFVVNSSSGTDASTFFYLIIN